VKQQRLTKIEEDTRNLSCLGYAAAWTIGMKRRRLLVGGRGNNSLRRQGQGGEGGENGFGVDTASL
jgi:hypothetical protein